VSFDVLHAENPALEQHILSAPVQSIADVRRPAQSSTSEEVSIA
jgi:hypothetical protein